MKITCDPAKRQWTMRERRLDLLRASEVFAGPHFTRVDTRRDYGELRYVTVGWLDSRIVALVWTLRDDTRRIISMRHCHEREAKKIRSQLS